MVENGLVASSTTSKSLRVFDSWLEVSWISLRPENPIAFEVIAFWAGVDLHSFERLSILNAIDSAIVVVIHADAVDQRTVIDNFEMQWFAGKNVDRHLVQKFGNQIVLGLRPALVLQVIATHGQGGQHGVFSSDRAIDRSADLLGSGHQLAKQNMFELIFFEEVFEIIPAVCFCVSRLPERKFLIGFELLI